MSVVTDAEMGRWRLINVSPEPTNEPLRSIKLPIVFCYKYQVDVIIPQNVGYLLRTFQN